METKKILSSKFFILGEAPIEIKKLEWYCLYWWIIQAPFTLGLNKLLNTISEKILYEVQNGTLETQKQWEDIFKSHALAIVDEMGLGRDSHGLMHHNLFAEQVYATTSLTDDDLRKRVIKMKTNVALRDAITQSFSSPLSGICMMYVVEKIAPQLFLTQKKIFLAAGAPIEKLRHSVLHEQLEKNHAEEAEEYLQILKNLFAEKEINRITDEYASLWKSFLDEIFEKLKV